MKVHKDRTGVLACSWRVSGPDGSVLIDVQTWKQAMAFVSQMLQLRGLRGL